MKTTNNGSDWMMDAIANTKPTTPTFPGKSLSNLTTEEKAKVLAAANHAGINESSVAGISTCGRYAISFGTAPGDLRFTAIQP